MVTRYKDLIAWQKSMELVVAVYRITRTFPESEKFGLSNQLRRAAVSIPSNIAEGQGRRLRKQFSAYLRIARGSVQEVETQLLIAARLGYARPEEIACIEDLAAEVGRILSGLLRSLQVRQK